MEDNFIKIINATYRLLDFFPDNDPLKNKAKEKALKILENLSLISDSSGWLSLKDEKVKVDLSDDIKILKSYLHLGKHQGWVGGINFLILQQEYERLLDKVRPLRNSVVSSLEVKKDEVLKQDKSAEPEVKEENKQRKIGGSRQSVVALPITKDLNNKAIKRQEKILMIISKKGGAQVADIIKEIPNITKRTIRRDIDDLLKGSRIIRYGEWNKVFYQIHSNKANEDKIPPQTEHPLV